MALPTPVKSWQYNVNQILPASGAAYDDHRKLLLAIKNALKGFASNGYGDHSPGHYSLFAGFLVEVVMTMMFLFIIMGATHGQAPAGFAPLAIGQSAPRVSVGINANKPRSARSGTMI